MSRRNPLVGGTPPAVRIVCSAGVGVGRGGFVGSEGGGDGGGVSAGVAVGVASGFFETVFFDLRRGGGVLRGWVKESPSRLKKSPIGFPAEAKSPPAQNVAATKVRMTLLKGTPIRLATLHYLRSCSTSRKMAVAAGKTPTGEGKIVFAVVGFPPLPARTSLAPTTRRHP